MSRYRKQGGLLGNPGEGYQDAGWDSACDDMARVGQAVAMEGGILLEDIKTSR